MRTPALHLIAACCLVFPAAAAAAEPRTTVVPEKRTKEYEEWHYAPAVRVGDLVVISGIPAFGPPPYADQVRRMFKAVEATLAAAGAKMEDVVEIQTFHSQARDTEAFGKEIKEFIGIHGEFFKAHYPAWTAVGGIVLLSPGAPVEMRVTALVGSGANAAMKK